MKLYSKPFNDVFKIKKDFFYENKNNLNNIIKINTFYSKQPIRKKCKNCNRNISDKDYLFKSFKIKYFFCKKCGHLNGGNEDTERFCNWLYQDKEGNKYKYNYLKDYDLRVKNIYVPKVEFLKKVIKSKINLVDVGCGAGHLLKALENKRINAYGLEPSRSLSILGNKKLKKNKIENVSLKKIFDQINQDNKSNILSLIGVLEHMRDPNSLLKVFLKSNIKYLFLSLPLFSMSSFVEHNFSNVFPRVLSGGHTHLYTKDSIQYLAKKNKLQIIGEWWFGSDMLDLYRSLMVSAKSIYYKKLLKKNLSFMIDNLQKTIDKNHLCNEVHLILKK